MNDIREIQIPVLKRRADERESKGAVAPGTRAAAGALFATAHGLSAGKSALLAMTITTGLGASFIFHSLALARQAELRASGVRSTVRPRISEESARLALAAQSAPGELKWAQPAPTEAEARAAEWASILGQTRRAGVEALVAARAVSHSALAQLRAADEASRAAAAQTGLEAGASASHGAFGQQLILGGGAPEILVDSLASSPSLGARSAPDALVSDASARNATPYQEMLDHAFEMAQESARLRGEAPKLLALGAALGAAGRAMLHVPGAGLAARGLIAAGLAAAGRGAKKVSQSRDLLARAHDLAGDIQLLEGQKAQRTLADVCLDVVAKGTSLGRCDSKSLLPSLSTVARADVDRELSDKPVWEVEGGRRVEPGL
jgi:hypothetical protein